MSKWGGGDAGRRRGAGILGFSHVFGSCGVKERGDEILDIKNNLLVSNKIF
jgi:hypothetical protein